MVTRKPNPFILHLQNQPESPSNKNKPKTQQRHVKPPTDEHSPATKTTSVFGIERRRASENRSTAPAILQPARRVVHVPTMYRAVLRERVGTAEYMEHAVHVGNLWFQCQSIVDSQPLQAHNAANSTQ